MSLLHLSNEKLGEIPGGQWLRLWAFTNNPGSISEVGELKTPKATWHGKKKIMTCIIHVIFNISSEVLNMQCILQTWSMRN